jgi:hypothetical protein
VIIQQFREIIKHNEKPINCYCVICAAITMRTFDLIRVSAVSGAAVALILISKSARACVLQLIEIIVEKCCSEIVNKVIEQ